MNNVLELRGKRFVQAPRGGYGGAVSMNSKKEVTTEHLIGLKDQLIHIKEYWLKESRPFEGILISVYYNKIVAKSKSKHIITYFLDLEDLGTSIELLSNIADILSREFSGKLTQRTIENEQLINSKLFKNLSVSMSVFKQVIADASYIDSFGVEINTKDFRQSIITLYDVKTDVKVLFEALGINILNTRILDNQTVYLDENQVGVLLEKAPYLVSMATANLTGLSPDDFMDKYQNDVVTIPSPTIEPTIGVIDTLFDENVYFNEWVEYHDMVSRDIPRSSNDYRHGTAVTSIIVDGERLNPWLSDGCGRFRVRHFGVAVGAEFSSFSIIKQIKSIVLSNLDYGIFRLEAIRKSMTILFQQRLRY